MSYTFQKNVIITTNTKSANLKKRTSEEANKICFSITGTINKVVKKL